MARKTFKRRSYGKRRGAGSYKRSNFKRRKTSMARPKLVAKVKKNTTKLNRVAKVVDATTGTHTYRRQQTTQTGSNFGSHMVVSVTGNSLLTTQAVLERLQYYDPSNPGTLLTGNGNTGDFQREFLFTRLTTKLTLNNQGFVPTNVRIYQCYPKEDTNIRPEAAWKNGLEFQLLDFSSTTGGTGPSVENFLSRPTDSEEFNNLWRTENFQEVRLQPGGQYTASVNLGGFTYDPTFHGDHAQAYKSSIKGMLWMIVSHGDNVTNSTNSDINVNRTDQLHIMHEETYEVKYDAGVSLNTLQYDNTGYDNSANGYGAVRPNVAQRNAEGDTRP